MQLSFVNALRVLNRKAVLTGDVEMYLVAGSGKIGIATQHQCRGISGQLRQPRRPRFNIVKAWDVEVKSNRKQPGRALGGCCVPQSVLHILRTAGCSAHARRGLPFDHH